MVRSPGTLSYTRSLLIVILSLVLAVLLLGELTAPFKRFIADRYRERGDSYLISLQYDQARSQYETALHYNSGDTLAVSHKHLADVAPSDIAQAKSFFVEHQVKAVLDKLNVAQAGYSDPKQALQVGANFYTAKDFVYAQYPLQRAVQLDPEYTEAWHYLLLDYQELAKIDAQYKTKADEAQKRQDDLSPKYLTP